MNLNYDNEDKCNGCKYEDSCGLSYEDDCVLRKQMPLKKQDKGRMSKIDRQKKLAYKGD